MSTRPARIVAGGNRRDRAPAAGSPGRAGRFVLAAAAGLALAFGALTGTTATHAAAAVSTRAAVAVQTLPGFEPCPCTDLVCRPVCVQGTASGGPAAMVHPQRHSAATAESARAEAAVQALPKFEPCPCAEPLCRPLCFQGLASGGTTAIAHPQRHLAASAESARAGAAVQTLPRFEPCPCADPLCRPVCFQSAASGGPAAISHLPKETP
jgi:hypothetical protein